MGRKRRTKGVGPLPLVAGGPRGGRAEAASRGVEAACGMASDACGTDPRRRPLTRQCETSSAGGSPETFTCAVPESPARTTASSTSAAAIVRRVDAGWGAVRAMTRWLMPRLSAGPCRTCVGVHPEIGVPEVLGVPCRRPGFTRNLRPRVACMRRRKPRAGTSGRAAAGPGGNPQAAWTGPRRRPAQPQPGTSAGAARPDLLACDGVRLPSHRIRGARAVESHSQRLTGEA